MLVTSWLELVFAVKFGIELCKRVDLKSHGLLDDTNGDIAGNWRLK